MIENATQSGIDPLKFWDYTPFELELIVNKYIEEEKKKAKDIISLSWYTEALHRQKKLPKLEKLLNNTPKKKMTAEEMANQVKKLNAIFGGEIK